jgi:four helix bundle protein
MATIKRFEDLEIWQHASELCKFINRLIERDKFKYNFSLKDQISRSSGSIMDNIAEGFERGGNKEFVNFLTYSKGSTGEVRSQSYRAFDIGLISQDEFDYLIKETNCLSERIGKLISYLRNTDYKGVKFKKDIDNNEKL